MWISFLHLELLPLITLGWLLGFLLGSFMH